MNKILEIIYTIIKEIGKKNSLTISDAHKWNALASSG